MNLIVGNKYRIYRSVMATFQGWDNPPEGLNVGDTVTLVSIEEDKNVVVRTKDNNCWYIKFTSLSHQEGEENKEVKEEAPVVPFDWDAFKDHVAKLRHDVPIISGENNISDDLIQKAEAIQKYVEYKDFGLCSFVYNGVVKEAGICYAAAMDMLLDNFIVSFGRLKKEPFNTPETKKYVEWVINESHFARYFKVKTFEEVVNSAVIFRFPKEETKAAITAAVMLRQAYEFPEVVHIFNELVNAGVEPTIAYLVACVTRGNIYETGNGHMVLSNVPYTMLEKQLLRNLPRNVKSIFECSGNSLRYGNDFCIVKEALTNLNLFEIDEFGYQRMKGQIYHETRMSVCEILAKKFQEKNNA